MSGTDTEARAFSVEEHQHRLAAVHRAISDRGFDAILVNLPANIAYLTGYHTAGYWQFQVLIVPVAGEPVIVLRLLETRNWEALSWLKENRPYGDTEDAIERTRMTLDEMGLLGKRLGFEKGSYFFRAGDQERLMAACRGTRFEDCSGLVERVRLVKSPAELAVMNQAAVAAAAGVRAGIDTATVELTENDVAAEVLRAMVKAGGEYAGSWPYIASGPRAAVGHATWQRRRIERDEFVFLEVGGSIHHYHAALIRLVYLGIPPTIVRETEKVVQDAMQATMEVIRPGVTAAQADAANRTLLARNTLGLHQVTLSGYSIGLGFPPGWGEPHVLSLKPNVHTVLEENMTLHIVPSLHMPGMTVFALSETVRVTATGCEVIADAIPVPRRLVVKPA